MLVLVEDGQPVDVFYFDHRPVEAAFFPRRCRALLTFDRVSVDVVARKTVFGGDEIGGDPLRHEVVLDGDGRIDRPGAAGSADTDAAHRLDTAANRHVLLS